MTRRIIVRTGARLHLGFYSFRSDELGRAYGGLGVAVEEPRVEIAVWECSSPRVECSSSSVAELAREVVSALGADVCVSFRSYIPRHVGLGSTTQTVLSVALATLRILGVDADPWSVAAAFGRGPVSGIGIATFLLGGLVVDSGVKLSALRKYPLIDATDLPRPIARVELPESWRFVIVVPHGVTGLEEREELPILSEPRALGKEREYELLKEVFLHLLPAATQGDAEDFGSALTKVQRIVGEYFSGAQGGIFAEPYGELIARALESCGSLCVGQSSWGPTMYGLSPSPEAARQLANCVESKLSSAGVRAQILVTAPRNRGFEILEE